MDNETFNALVFMAFGLGFFLLSVRLVSRDHREAYERRLMEAREFGYKVVHKIKNSTPPDPEKK